MKLRKYEKQVKIAIVIETEKLGDFSPNTHITFEVPKPTKYKPIWLYVYEAEKLGDDVLVAQYEIKLAKVNIEDQE